MSGSLNTRLSSYAGVPGVAQLRTDGKMFELPGFAKAAAGTKASSMDALRQAKETACFKDGDTMWVKLVAAAPVMKVIRPTDLQASMTVSRQSTE
jgi:hypothetical protein